MGRYSYTKSGIPYPSRLKIIIILRGVKISRYTPLLNRDPQRIIYMMSWCSISQFVPFFAPLPARYVRHTRFNAAVDQGVKPVNNFSEAPRLRRSYLIQKTVLRKNENEGSNPMISPIACHILDVTTKCIVLQYRIPSVSQSVIRSVSQSVSQISESVI